MKLNAFIAILICKFIRFCCRLVGRGGTSMPGKISLKLCPKLLTILAKDTQIIAVTGTNGKTTCSHMIEKALTDNGFSTLTNRAGANLISGITTEFAMNSSLLGKCHKKYAVIEVDESAACNVMHMLQPKIVVVTNLFRDQLDRYGEVMHALDRIRISIEKVPDATLVLNADCSLTASLASSLSNRCVFFGIEKGVLPNHEIPEISDAPHCIRCKAKYNYDYITFAHLGGFFCPQCGYSRPFPEYRVDEVYSNSGNGSTFRIRSYDREETLSIHIPAVYNVYNAIASFAALHEFGLSNEGITNSFKEFQCGFGRMEKFPLGQEGSLMMLVKNPASCNQVLAFIEAQKEESILVACLNDREADGQDISWIWDVDFEKLSICPMKKIYISGDRASDLRVRLKYAGIPLSLMVLESDYPTLVQQLSESTLPIYIISTYTAMLELRAEIVKKCGGSNFWED